MTGPTLDNPAQENNLIVPFLNRDVVVLHTFTSLRQISQLMVVSCKQGLGCHLGIVMQVFSHSPGDTDAVKSGGSAADFIEDNQTALVFFKQKTAYEISECDWSSDVE